MACPSSQIDLQRALEEALYVETLMLADASQTYFQGVGCIEREALPSLARVVFSREAVKITTRIMHALAWLLTQKALTNGKLKPHDALDSSRRLATPPKTDPIAASLLPREALRLISVSVDLYRRVSSLNEVLVLGTTTISPALLMQQKLELAFAD